MNTMVVVLKDMLNRSEDTHEELIIASKTSSIETTMSDRNHHHQYTNTPKYHSSNSDEHTNSFKKKITTVVACFDEVLFRKRTHDESIFSQKKIWPHWVSQTSKPSLILAVNVDHG